MPLEYDVFAVLCLTPPANLDMEALLKQIIDRDNLPFPLTNDNAKRIQNAIYQTLTRNFQNITDMVLPAFVEQALSAGVIAALTPYTVNLVGCPLNLVGLTQLAKRTIDNMRLHTLPTSTVPLDRQIINWKIMATTALSEALVPLIIGDQDIIAKSNSINIKIHIMILIILAYQLYCDCKICNVILFNNTNTYSYQERIFIKTAMRLMVTQELITFARTFDYKTDSEKRLKIQQITLNVLDAFAGPNTNLRLVSDKANAARMAKKALGDINSLYEQRIGRARTYRQRSDIEEDAYSYRRVVYYTWIVAYIIIFITCLILILLEHDKHAFILAISVIGIQIIDILVKMLRGALTAT